MQEKYIKEKKLIKENNDTDIQTTALFPFPNKLVAYAVHWEGKSLECDNCNKTIESEYGDPQEEV